MKFHEEIDQFTEQFKGEIIGQHFQYLLNTKTMFMNRGGHDLKTRIKLLTFYFAIKITGTEIGKYFLD